MWYIKNKLYILIALLALTKMYACNMEKEVEVDLPAFQSQLVVESYMEPGQPYRLLLTEISSYFDSVRTPFINNAKVSVTQNGITSLLYNNYEADTTYRKLYNFISQDTVPFDYNSDFILNIEDTKGRKVTARTKILPVVKIDSVEWKFREDSSAYLLTWFYDDAAISNYYRLIINKNKINKNAEVNFQFDDSRLNGQRIPLGTGFRFNVGDTVYVRLYHLDKKYYEYLESTENARSSNGNPFSQPSTIKSGVTGGLGVFGGLSYDSKTVIIR